MRLGGQLTGQERAGAIPILPNRHDPVPMPAPVPVPLSTAIPSPSPRFWTQKALLRPLRHVKSMSITTSGSSGSYTWESGRPLAAALIDILDAGGGVHVQLAAAFTQEELDSCEVSSVDLDVLVELVTSKLLEMRSCGKGLLPALAETLTVETDDLLLQP